MPRRELIKFHVHAAAIMRISVGTRKPLCPAFSRAFINFSFS